MKKFEKWLETYYVPVYYSTIWKSKLNNAEYTDMQLKQIYDSVIKFIKE